MAISNAAGSQTSARSKNFNVIASADADTGDHNIAHGMGVAPDHVFLTTLLGAGNISGWVLKSVDATNIVITKTSTGAGSGNASAQLRVTALLQHTLTA